MAASTTPISTYKVYLMKGTLSTDNSTVDYSKLIDIKDFSDLMDAPEALETTTLSDASRTYILGIQEQEAITCTANYTKANMTLLTGSGIKDTECYYAIWFGGTYSSSTSQVEPDGADGKYSFKGYLTPSINGGGVNEVVDMTITIAPTTVIMAG